MMTGRPTGPRRLAMAVMLTLAALVTACSCRPDAQFHQQPTGCPRSLNRSWWASPVARSSRHRGNVDKTSGHPHWQGFRLPSPGKRDRFLMKYHLAA